MEFRHDAIVNDRFVMVEMFRSVIDRFALVERNVHVAVKLVVRVPHVSVSGHCHSYLVLSAPVAADRQP